MSRRYLLKNPHANRTLHQSVVTELADLARLGIHDVEQRIRWHDRDAAPGAHFEDLVRAAGWEKRPAEIAEQLRRGLFGVYLAEK
jgi:hypothetical protein